MTLRVLAKFLGFLESLPYRCDPLGESLIESAASVRMRSVPAIALAEVVQEAATLVGLVLIVDFKWRL